MEILHREVIQPHRFDDRAFPVGDPQTIHHVQQDAIGHRTMLAKMRTNSFRDLVAFKQKFQLMLTGVTGCNVCFQTRPFGFCKLVLHKL